MQADRTVLDGLAASCSYRTAFVADQSVDIVHCVLHYSIILSS